MYTQTTQTQTYTLTHTHTHFIKVGERKNDWFKTLSYCSALLHGIMAVRANWYTDRPFKTQPFQNSQSQKTFLEPTYFTHYEFQICFNSGRWLKEEKVIAEEEEIWLLCSSAPWLCKQEQELRGFIGGAKLRSLIWHWTLEHLSYSFCETCLLDPGLIILLKVWTTLCSLGPLAQQGSTVW